MARQSTFAIVVRQLVPTHRLYAPADRENHVAGAYEIKARSEEQALDQFDKTVPIANRADFEISVTRLSPA